jgi:hypothetical protein
MQKRSTPITFKGKWDVNIPSFLSSKSGQEKYDLFMAIKHNINNSNIMANLFHRFLGDYQERNRVYFTDVFKQLKQWLFGSYRTEHITQLAYLSINKGFNAYKTFTASKDTLYKEDLALFYPEEFYMCVTTRQIEEPVYYTYKPRRIYLQNHKNGFQDITTSFQPTVVTGEKENENNNNNNYNEDDDDDDIGIPKPKSMVTSHIQTVKMFEYMNRNFMVFPCDYCHRDLDINTLGYTTCTHMCHRSCLGHGYKCFCCESEMV